MEGVGVVGKQETNITKKKKKRYSQAVKDGFAEQREGDDGVESEEEEGMIGRWSNEEGRRCD